MKSFKEQCVALRKKDKTINEIMAITGRSKSSIYTHIKDISLSKEKLDIVNVQSRARALINAEKRRGVSVRSFKAFNTWSPDRVLLVAHLIFDGELKNRTCGYINRSMALVLRVETLLAPIYNFEPKRHYDTVSGVHKIRYYNVALKNYLEDKARELRKTIASLSLECQREFLRAFFDDEGCMDYRPNRNVRQIRGYQKDRDILNIIQKLLHNFGIEAKIKEPNEIVIVGKENLKKFEKEINFSKGVKLNPRRANSIWKKEIEKRDLLESAIKSFKT